MKNGKANTEGTLFAVDPFLWQYGMEIFKELGYTDSKTPEYMNHTSKQAIYFDMTKDISLSRYQRGLLKHFTNVSRLFTISAEDLASSGWESIAFYSIDLLVSQQLRSEAAVEIHSLVQKVSDTPATVCLFKLNEHVLLSFAGFSRPCVLSDWFHIGENDFRLMELLDLGNVSMRTVVDFFYDLAYAAARKYYIYPVEDETVFSLLPYDYHISGQGVVSPEEIVKAVQQSAEDEYGSDYVYQELSDISISENISMELETLLLDLDLDEEDDDNPFGEEIEDERYDELEDDLDEIDEETDVEDDLDEIDEETDVEDDLDEIDKETDVEDDLLEKLEEINPEFFNDPTQLVKWLNQMDS